MTDFPLSIATRHGLEGVVKANLEQQKISILAPIGTAILGYRAGDAVEWQVPGGIRKLRIEEVLYQPEAAGHYSL